jgi:hypothetical protein
MIVSCVRIARLINTGDYENTRFEVEAVLDDGDDPADVAAELADQIRAMAQVELIRRYPAPDDRRWHHWLTPEEEAATVATIAAVAPASTDLSSSEEISP